VWPVNFCNRAREHGGASLRRAIAIENCDITDFSCNRKALVRPDSATFVRFDVFKYMESDVPPTAQAYHGGAMTCWLRLKAEILSIALMVRRGNVYLNVVSDYLKTVNVTIATRPSNCSFPPSGALTTETFIKK